MIRLPPRSTRTDTRFPYTTLFRSMELVEVEPAHVQRHLDIARGVARRHQPAAPRHGVDHLAEQLRVGDVLAHRVHSLTAGDLPHLGRPIPAAVVDAVDRKSVV